MIEGLDFFKYLWVVYAIFVLVVVFIVLALIYHWGKYAQIRKIRFKFIQTIFIFGIVLLLMISFIFYTKI
jgi:CDP-diglyceride synthetase